MPHRNRLHLDARPHRLAAGGPPSSAVGAAASRDSPCSPRSSLVPGLGCFVLRPPRSGYRPHAGGTTLRCRDGWSAVGGSAVKISVYTVTLSGTYSISQRCRCAARVRWRSKTMAGHDRLRPRWENSQTASVMSAGYLPAGGIKLCRSLARALDLQVCRRHSYPSGGHVLHKRRPEWSGQRFCRFPVGPGGPRIVRRWALYRSN